MAAINVLGSNALSDRLRLRGWNCVAVVADSLDCVRIFVPDMSPAGVNPIFVVAEVLAGSMLRHGPPCRQEG